MIDLAAIGGLLDLGIRAAEIAVVSYVGVCLVVRLTMARRRDGFPTAVVTRRP